MGPPSNLNYQINHGAWAEAFERDRPHLEFCGRVALAQLRAGRFFFAENPWPTWLTHVHPWPLILNRPGVYAPVFDQCRLGLVNAAKQPVKKPTVGICNHTELARPFTNLRCNCPGPNAHGNTWGAPGGIVSLQVWPWKFAERIESGIARLKAVHTCAQIR